MQAGDAAAPACQPQDTLYRWWLGQPAAPVWIGTLHTVRAFQGVSLRYVPQRLQHGFALSEDLPLLDGPPRLSLMERPFLRDQRQAWGSD